MARLDYFLIADSLMGNIDTTEIYPGFRSDHCLITISLNFEEFERGPGFWKCNTRLLENEGFLEKLRIVIEEFKVNRQGLTPDKLSENIKYEIRQFCIEESINTSRERKEKINELNKRKIELVEACCFGVSNEDEQANVDKQIEEYYQEVKSSMFRSKCKWYYEGEKNTKYFCYLEKFRYRQKSMTCVVRPMVPYLEIKKRY